MERTTQSTGKDIPIQGLRGEDGRVNVFLLQEILSTARVQHAITALIALDARIQPHVATDRILTKSRKITIPDEQEAQTHIMHAALGRPYVDSARLVTIVKKPIVLEINGEATGRDRFEIIHEHVITDYDPSNSCKGILVHMGESCPGICILQLDDGPANQALFVQDESENHMVFASHIVHELLNHGAISASSHEDVNRQKVDTFIIADINNTILAAYDISNVGKLSLTRAPGIPSELCISPQDVMSKMECYYHLPT